MTPQQVQLLESAPLLAGGPVVLPRVETVREKVGNSLQILLVATRMGSGNRYLYASDYARVVTLLNQALDQLDHVTRLP